MLRGQELVTERDLIEVTYDLLTWVIGLALAQVAMLVGILAKVSGGQPAHPSMIFCSALSPSVREAGPGCKINGDLIS